MANIKVLLEVMGPGATDSTDDAFEKFSAAAESTRESEAQLSQTLESLAGAGVEVDPRTPPVPMFHLGTEDRGAALEAMATFAPPPVSGRKPRRAKVPVQAAQSIVVSAEVSPSKLKELRERMDVGNVRVWPDSELVLLTHPHAFDLAVSRGGLDCRPFQPGATIETIRELLGVAAAWTDGFRGQNITVGIIDEGVNGEQYPVVGGFSRPETGRQPGDAPITSHGSMCAADILIAAPAARLYDYPFLEVPTSGGALQMFQAVLTQRRADGTPHVTNNSYGFVSVPLKEDSPNHEIHDLNHPLHRKVREVIAAGVACFFAAGNCGSNCPSSKCKQSSIGPGRSIHACNSMEEVITVAAVNSRHDRIGYSSQGPGMFHRQKPDVASYSHIFANFGPGRPGGDTVQSFDNGTSAATPVAAGVCALLLSAFQNLDPAALKAILVETASSVGPSMGWNAEYGHGVINAGAAYSILKRRAAPTS